jgi:DNA sulfur modification protein DndE
MIETIRVSELAKNRLSKIKRRTGIENWNIICRWAFLMSIKSSDNLAKEENHESDSNVEMTWRTFAGIHDKLFLALLLQILKKQNIEINKKNVNHYFRIHLHRGISILASSQSKSLADYCKEFIK